VAGEAVEYEVYSLEEPLPDGGVLNDEDGVTYVPASFVSWNPAYADLIAYHERTEVRLELRGRPHAYAHRRALVAELVAAMQMFETWEDRDAYVRWRIRSYPRAKIPEPNALASELIGELSAESPRIGRLFSRIKENRL